MVASRYAKRKGEMRVLVIGASGLVGVAAADALAAVGCDLVRASRSGEPSVDITDRGDYVSGYYGKVQAQVDVVRARTGSRAAVMGVQTGRVLALDRA